MSVPEAAVTALFTCMECGQEVNPVVIERVERNGFPHILIYCLKCWENIE